MPLFRFAPFLASTAALSLGASHAAFAQNHAPVSAVSAPIPLAGDTPVPPQNLRKSNPTFVLPMTGTWKFSLTHGRIGADSRFTKNAPPPARARGQVAASSEEAGNTADLAFDSNADTRWCAENETVPQWVRADLGTPRTITKVDLDWEKPGGGYQSRSEISDDGQAFKPWTPEASPARYVRVLVTGAGAGNWASIRECRIHFRDAATGTDTVWRPASRPAPPPAAEVAPLAAATPEPIPAFAASDFDDAKWDKIQTPSNWEMLGYSIPTYNSVDDTVGLYRRAMGVPAGFANRRIIWRFDGVLEGTEVWINGRRAGYHESGYTAWDIDITDLVRAGAVNTFVLRVTKNTPSSDAETGDFQCMGGLYRENYLVALPQTHIHTLTLTTPLAADYKNATLQAAASVMGTPGQTVSVSGVITDAASGKPLAANAPLTGTATIGADGKAALVLSAPVSAPKLWSAEKPNLYYLVLTLKDSAAPQTTVERVEERFGFRQVEIKNGITLWNGKPIKCYGVCRHDFWADKGFALTDTEWRRDLTLMRAANINAIRTSHYNHAARFIEMCDEMGFYLLDEVPFCWINNKFSDPNFLPPLLQRTEETIARDHNHASVLAWSIGNENGHGSDGQALLNLAHALDPTRPAFVSQQSPSGYAGQSFRDSHYPTPSDFVYLVAPNASGLSEPVLISEHPHMFYQREAVEYDAGLPDLWAEALQNAWNLISPQPTVLGGFIWEWQNQGIADKNPDHTRDFYYGSDYLRQENNKGVVDAFRNPKPEYWYVRDIYSPVEIGTPVVSSTTVSVPITNRFTFTNLSDLTCRWTATTRSGGVTQTLSPVACLPGASAVVKTTVPPGATVVKVEFFRPDGTLVIGRTVSLAASGPPRLDRSAAFAAHTVSRTPTELRIASPGGGGSTLVWDTATGSLRSWRVGGRDLLGTGDGSGLNLGLTRRRGSDAPKDYLYGPEPPQTNNHRLTVVDAGGGDFLVTSVGSVSLSEAGGPRRTVGGRVLTYTVHANGSLDVAWKLFWRGGQAHAWETGFTFPVAPTLTQMRWSRQTPYTDLPADHIGAAEGVARPADLAFRASHRDLLWLSLTGPDNTGLAIAHQPGFPLIGRAGLPAKGSGFITLFASSAVAGPRDLSHAMVADRDITLQNDESVSGQFRLYPTR